MTRQVWRDVISDELTRRAEVRLPRKFRVAVTLRSSVRFIGHVETEPGEHLLKIKEREDVFVYVDLAEVAAIEVMK